MSVSILVPIYNVEKYIERCARSLFEQTYSDIDYIFVDDFSPDNSIEILEKTLDEYPERKEHVRIIRHEKNRGLAAARNTAVENCQTDFLIHVDSDDYIEKDAVEKFVIKQKEDDYDIVTGNALIIYQDSKKLLREDEPIDKEELTLLYIKPIINHVIWGRLIRTSLYKENHIQALEGCNIGEDHQVIPRLFYYAKKVSSIENAIYNYDCTNPNSYMSQSSSVEKFGNKVKQDLLSFDCLREFFETCPEDVYKQQVYQELCRYTYTKASFFSSHQQPHCFNLLWQYFFSIDKKYRKNLSGRCDALSLFLKSHYFTALLISKLR